ncbi:unnamed protein product, partial [Vitis vinifera]|uniref:Uncharacterized protein n=1 Tax=Vitis vinifera TaxID=29760 RepID=D7T3S2_VITVI
MMDDISKCGYSPDEKSHNGEGWLYSLDLIDEHALDVEWQNIELDGPCSSCSHSLW